MLILGLLGMYFDAAVVFVTKSSLLFKLAEAILCDAMQKTHHFDKKDFMVAGLCLRILPAGIYPGRVLLTTSCHYCRHY